MSGLGLHDHCCWVATAHDDFGGAAHRFLSDGLALGAKCIVVSRRSGGDPTLAARDAGWDGVEWWALDDLYAEGEPVRPEETVERYEAATRRAVEEGFTGFRVAADTTTLVATPRQRAAFIEYEWCIEELIQRAPFSAVCSFDRRELADETVVALAAMHPVRRAGHAPFSVALGDDPGTLVVDGQIDQFQAVALDAVVDRSPSLLAGETTRLDMSAVTFVDHQTLLALDEVARRRDARVTLLHASALVRRLVDILGLTHVDAR